MKEASEPLRKTTWNLSTPVSTRENHPHLEKVEALAALTVAMKQQNLNPAQPLNKLTQRHTLKPRQKRHASTGVNTVYLSLYCPCTHEV